MVPESEELTGQRVVPGVTPDRRLRDHAAPAVVAVVLAWNGQRWIDRCLDSLSRTAYPALSVWVVDNGSRDGTPEAIATRFAGVRLLRQRRNLGFAEGNNVGIRAALRTDARYVALLNQDAWVEPGWLAPLIEAAEADARLGILSPAQLEYDGDACDPSFARLLDGRGGGPVLELPTAIGAALVVRRRVFEEVGLFDPLYFAYFEEADLCRRARARGWRTAVVPAGRIHHWHRLLHPEAMPLGVKLLAARNQFVFALKDPEASLWENLRECARLGAVEARYCLRHPRGLRGGAARAAALAWIALWCGLNLPRVLRHRARERRRPAYL